MTFSYPILLDLSDKSCVVMGGGKVATRKVHGLLEAGAQITVISPEVTDELRTYDHNNQIRWIKGYYQQGSLAQYRPALVFATTNVPVVNQQIADEAKSLAVWVNIANEGHEGDFTNMMTFRRPPITISISTGASSPALSKHLIGIVEQAIGDEYATLARWLGDVREQVKTTVPTQSQRHALYQQIIDSDILAQLRNNEVESAFAHFQNLIHEAVQA